jgi:predicted ATPase
MRQELRLQLALGTGLLRTKGFSAPEGKRAFARARTLCHSMQARLWTQQGKRAAARDELESVYSCFAEGLDTGDLRSARALLDLLGN